MITVTLKRRHLLLVLGHQLDTTLRESMSTANRIISVCTGKQDNDDVQIQIEWEKLWQSYNIMTNLPSGAYKTVNTEMDTMLAPQMQAGVQSGNQDWIELATRLTALKQQQAAVTVDFVTKVKNDLGLNP